MVFVVIVVAVRGLLPIRSIRSMVSERVRITVGRGCRAGVVVGERVRIVAVG